MPVTNEMLNAAKEVDCIGITTERKYYETGSLFIKRSLRPDEWQLNHISGTTTVPRMNDRRLRNEAAALKFVATHTNVPVPKLHACFEDSGAVYLITEFVEGVAMNELDQIDQQAVQQELEDHLQTLHGLKRYKPGGVSGLVVPPYRACSKSARNVWELCDADEELVFCHNDLSMQNIIVDGATLKIKAIIDWEYAGFWPVWVERPFYTRLGPSVALEGETDDAEAIVEFMTSLREPGT